MGPITGATAEQLTRALGEAVVRTWSNLPKEVQNCLFHEAVTSRVNPSDRSLRSSCMPSIRARRIHWANRAK